MKKEKEYRVLQIKELRILRDSEGEPTISGYAAVFNKLSEDLGGFREKIEPGAFKGAIKSSDARALFNHNPDYVLGRQSNKTLRLKEDDKGLFMEVDPPGTQLIRDLVITPIERGDIREQSFGFIVESDKWEGLDDTNSRSKEPLRTILKVSELFDVSPVTYAAYHDTKVAVRSLELAKEHIHDPSFVPLSIPELFRDYADKWDEISKRPEKDGELVSAELANQIMTELKDRFLTADPTKGDNKGEPTQAPDKNSEPTQAETAEEREKKTNVLERIKKRGI